MRVTTFLALAPVLRAKRTPIAAAQKGQESSTGILVMAGSSRRSHGAFLLPHQKHRRRLQVSPRSPRPADIAVPELVHNGRDACNNARVVEAEADPL